MIWCGVEFIMGSDGNKVEFITFGIFPTMDDRGLDILKMMALVQPVKVMTKDDQDESVKHQQASCLRFGQKTGLALISLELRNLQQEEHEGPLSGQELRLPLVHEAVEALTAWVVHARHKGLDSKGKFITITANTATIAHNPLLYKDNKEESTTIGISHNMMDRDLQTRKEWAPVHPDEMHKDEEELGSLLGRQEVHHHLCQQVCKP